MNLRWQYLFFHFQQSQYSSLKLNCVTHKTNHKTKNNISECHGHLKNLKHMPIVSQIAQWFLFLFPSEIS